MHLYKSCISIPNLPLEFWTLHPPSPHPPTPRIEGISPYWLDLNGKLCIMGLNE